MEKITQDLLNGSVANTEEFWLTYHKSLNAPYHPHHEFRDKSLSGWVNSISQNSEMISALEHFLFNFPVLKGETFLTYGEAMTLTNYRLIMNDADIGMTNIPLSAIVSCEEDKVAYLKNGQTVTLGWNNINPGVVNAAISREDFKELDEVKNSILESNFYDLEKNESLIIPKTSWNESLKLIDNNSGSTNDETQETRKTKFLHFGLSISMILLLIATQTLPVVSGLGYYWTWEDISEMGIGIDGRPWALLLVILAVLGDLGHSFGKKIVGKIFRTLNIILTILFWFITAAEGGDEGWAFTGIVLYSILIILGWFASSTSNSYRYPEIS